MRNKCAICVQICVKHVQWNVKRWVEKWKFVKNVQKCAENVHKNVVV